MVVNEEVVLTARTEEKPKAATKKLKASFLQLRRAMISLMLAGYGLQKAMFGLLRNSFQMVGIFDMLNVTLGVVFLPIALALLDVLIPILSWFMNLPEPVQMAIGVFTLLAGVIGVLLGFFGAIGAALTGLTPILAILGTSIEGILVFFSGLLSLPVLAFFGALLIAVIGFVSAWQDNFGKIRDWVAVFIAGVSEAFNGLKMILKAIIDFWYGLLTGNSKKMEEAIKTGIEGMKEFLGGLGKMILGLLVTLGLSILKVFVNVITAGFQFGKDLVMKIIDGIKSIGYKIAETLLSFLPSSVRDSISGFLGISSKGKQSEPLSNAIGSSMNPYQANIQSSLQVTVVAPNDYAVNVRNGAGTP